jgi:hypothetical protein
MIKQKNDIKMQYLDDGRGIYVFEQLDNGQYLIAEALFDIDEYGMEDPRYYPSSSLHVVDKVYDIPPKIKYFDEIAKLTKSIDALIKQKVDIEESISNLKEKEKYTLDKLKNFDKLQYLLDFIDGKITHYVFVHWSEIEIVEYKDSKSEYGHDMRLLSLFGSTKGDIKWKINQYSDGSGANTEVIPCLSYEMALSEAQKHIDKTISEGKYPSLSIINSAIKYGLTIPDWYIEKYREQWNTDNDNSIEKLESQIADYKNRKCPV